MANGTAGVVEKGECASSCAWRSGAPFIASDAELLVAPGRAGNAVSACCGNADICGGDGGSGGGGSYGGESPPRIHCHARKRLISPVDPAMTTLAGCGHGVSMLCACLSVSVVFGR